MGKEFELKFAATPAQQDTIAEELGGFAPIAMETTYYDTPEGILSAMRITLRRRLENGQSVCTVKTPAKDGARGEWETECDAIEAAVPILCKLGCPVDLPLLTKDGLQPICGARFTRLAKTVVLENCAVEIAVDRGVLTGGGREMPLCEVEVELKSGDTAAAIAYANALAKQYDLVPEEKSKFRRALNLARGE